MTRSLKYIFVSTLFLLNYNINISEASIFDDTLFKIKSILNIENKEISKELYKQEEEPALKARYNGDNLDTNIEKNKNTKTFTFNSNQNNVENILRAEVGPMRTSTDDELIDSENIQVYEVKEGDTLSAIASLYGVSKNTIAWANDIKNGKPKVGEILIILPVSGIKHTIKKGDTLKSLAKKYSADALDIKEFNNIKETDTLSAGEEIIIPDGKMNFDAPVIKKPSAKKKIYASAGSGYYARPLIGGIRTQGIHGHNGVDIAGPVCTSLLASAGGSVLVAKNSGYNGGYGKMVIINHSNGSQTLYAHMNNVYVSTGQTVSQGEVIGELGNTGKSTGPHIHFEIRGAENPF